MSEVIKYRCNCCGEEHEKWPALTFNSPDPYYFLSDNEKQEIAELGSDFCIINYSDQTDRFIRCTFSQLVTDHCDDLDYGVWVSLSEKSFNDYKDNYNNEAHEVIYFGWLSNNISEYSFEESVPLNVVTQKGNQRPRIEPHSSFQYPFIDDFYNGITKAEAEKRINDMISSAKS